MKEESHGHLNFAICKVSYKQTKHFLRKKIELIIEKKRSYFWSVKFAGEFVHVVEVISYICIPVHVHAGHYYPICQYRLQPKSPSSYVNVTKIYHSKKYSRHVCASQRVAMSEGAHNFINIGAPKGHNQALCIWLIINYCLTCCFQQNLFDKSIYYLKWINTLKCTCIDFVVLKGFLFHH